MDSTFNKAIGCLLTEGQFQKAIAKATTRIDEAIAAQNVEQQLTSCIQRLKLYLSYQAIEQATDDLRICEQLMNEYDMYAQYAGIVYCSSGILNTLTGNDSVAYEQFSLAISFAYEHDDWRTVSTAYAKISALPHLQVDEAIAFARTAALFAHRAEHENDVFIIRALVQLGSLYIQALQFPQALSLLEQLQPLLKRHYYVREQLQTETLWLHYYHAQRTYTNILNKASSLLQKAKYYNQFDIYGDILQLMAKTYNHLQLHDQAWQYEVQYNQLQHTLQQHPICNELIEETPSHFEGLHAFKEEAQHYIHSQDGYALLLFYVAYSEPLTYERTQQIFQKLHFFLAQTNITVITYNMFETSKVLYIVKDGFNDAVAHLQRAIDQTLLHVEEPINLLFGHTHNIEHDTYTFEECLAICHAYLYYNQWALTEKVK